MKIVKSPEESGLYKKFENKKDEQKDGFLGMLLGTLASGFTTENCTFSEGYIFNISSCFLFLFFFFFFLFFLRKFSNKKKKA